MSWGLSSRWEPDPNVHCCQLWKAAQWPCLPGSYSRWGRDLSPGKLFRNNDVNPSQRMWEQCSNLTKWAISAMRTPEKLGPRCSFSHCSKLNTVRQHGKDWWGGGVGGVGSGQQHTVPLAQISLPCCCFGNLS